LDLDFLFHVQISGLVDVKINGMFSFGWKRSIPYFPTLGIL
jgi:hypothetical protein